MHLDGDLAGGCQARASGREDLPTRILPGGTRIATVWARCAFPRSKLALGASYLGAERCKTPLWF